jgi:prophage regulatory protein
MIRFVRLPEVIARRGKRRTAIYNDIDDGTFPPGVDLGGGRAKGWPEHEVEAVNAALLAGKAKAELRELVANLLAARKVAA